MERVQGQVLRRIIGLPRTTSYWGILCELGMWPVESILLYKRLMIYHQIENAKDERLAQRIVEQQKKDERATSWYGEMKERVKKMKVNLEEAKTTPKSLWKKMVKKRINENVEEEAGKEIKERTKLRTIRTFGLKQYVNEMSAEEVRKVMEIKLHMTKLKGNYGIEGMCSLCGKEKETTEHMITCERIPEEWKEIKEKDLESEDKQTLRKVVMYYGMVNSMME